MSVTQEVVTEDTGPPVTGLPAFYLEKYIEARERRRAAKKLFEEKDEPLKKLETDLGLWIQKYLLEAGLDNIKTKVGTAFLTTKTTASLQDPDLFMQHVISTGQFELLDRKANMTAVREYLKEHGALPPGANLSSIQTVGVHKKVGGKIED